MIKKLASLILISTMLLTSCLREADSPLPDSTEPHTVTQNVTEGTAEMPTDVPTEDSTMEEYPAYEPYLSDSAKTWVELRAETDDVMMTFEQIALENERVCRDSDVMADIMLLPDVFTADDIRSFIAKGHVPNLPRYDSDGAEISSSHLDTVIASMGESQIPEENIPRRAIVTIRANLRAIPDDKPYRQSPGNLYDTIQQTELHVGTPVWVLYESTDREYLLVRSSNYVGWVKAENIAFSLSHENWLEFVAPENFVCITDTAVKLDGNELDMGVVLPLISEDMESFTVKLPIRNADATLGYMDLRLARTSANKGFLEFTYKNFISQAFKYEGVMYSWGGLDSGVDCSGFISNVLRTFGFRLPRDTKDQQNIVGASLDVRGKSHSEIAQLLDNTKNPTAVYYPGHVLFYLGKGALDGKYYFIHAPQIGEAVSVTAKTSLEGMTYICEFTANEEVKNEAS